MSFIILTVRETMGQAGTDIPPSLREHYVRGHDSQNGKTLFVTQSYANRASARRAGQRLENRMNGGSAVLAGGTYGE